MGTVGNWSIVGFIVVGTPIDVGRIVVGTVGTISEVGSIVVGTVIVVGTNVVGTVATGLCVTLVVVLLGEFVPMYKGDEVGSTNIGCSVPVVGSLDGLGVV